MKYKDFIKYFENKEEKPAFTNSFIKEYQQTNSGKGTYLHEAIIQGKMIYKSMGEPNQKWHLTESWYRCKIKDNPAFADMEVRSWCGLSCPELMLWIAEVCGQKEKVEKLVTEEFIKNEYKNNDRAARNAMIRVIKNAIKWTDIMDVVEEKYSQG